jgi:predicted nucleic acid-binding protein
LGAQTARDWKQNWPIEPVSLADEEKAKAIIRRYTDKTFSYTDATSFMERVGAREALSLLTRTFNSTD